MSDSTSSVLLKSTKKTVEELKLYDIRRKMNLAKFIVTACMNQTINKTDITKNTFYTEAQNYITTSDLLMTTILAKINNKSRPKTFSDWFKERSWENSEVLNNATQSLDLPLRRSIINHYVYKQSVPTYASICDDLKEKGIKMTVDEIKKILITKGYKSQRLPRSTVSIIVEDPKQRLNRMRYLFNILQFRGASLHIVYIEENIMNNEENFSANAVETSEVILTLIAVSSLMGVISKKIQKTTFNETNNRKDFGERDNWIINSVLPNLSTPSVIVLGEKTNDIKSHIPTINSKKSDMINWLKDNEIPHSSEMHSAELFELIKRSKHNFPEEKHKIDEILIAHGHKVLRRPRRPQFLNIFDTYWTQLQNVFEEDETVTTFQELIDFSLCSIDVSEWKKLEGLLMETEQKVYSDDNAVDDVLDKLFTYAEHATLPYIYIHKCDEDIDEIKMAEIVQV